MEQYWNGQTPAEAEEEMTHADGFSERADGDFVASGLTDDTAVVEAAADTATDGNAPPLEEEIDSGKPPPKSKKKAKREKESEPLEDEGQSPSVNPLEPDDTVEPAYPALSALDMSETLPDSADRPPEKKPTATVRAGTAEKQPPKQGHRHYRSLDLAALDRGLTDLERKEWNAIYASHGSKSMLNGPLMGVDTTQFRRRDATGKNEQVKIRSGIIISYRVKVMIPEPEMWMPDYAPPDYVLGGLVGASLDYIITDIDREGEVAIASRRLALAAKRRHFANTRNGHQAGEKLQCAVLVVGPTRCLVECQGYDIELRPRDMSYTRIEDMREVYRPGDVLDCVLVDYSPDRGLSISVRGVQRNPFDGVEQRHPVCSRRQAVITGKYAGGIYCTLPDDVVCMCFYTAQLCDEDFQLGDKVILLVEGYVYDLQRMRGRILKKW